MAKPKKKDLDSAVQTSLGLADTALQSETDPVWSSEKASYVPYTGATGTVNLGTNDLTTSGIGTFGKLKTSDTVTSGVNSFAWGKTNIDNPGVTTTNITASGIGSFAGGYATDYYYYGWINGEIKASGVGSFAWGNVGLGLNARASGDGSLVLVSGTASGLRSIVFGSGTASATDSITIFGNSKGTYAFSVGQSSLAKGTGSVALVGKSIGNNSLALGFNTISYGSSSNAIGNTAKVKGTNGTAIGSYAISSETDVTSIGKNVYVLDTQTLGSEKITNGTFTGSSTGWTLGTGWAYSSNTVTKNADGTGTLSQSSASMVTPLVAGEMYYLRYQISSFTTGTFTVSCGGVTFTANTTDITSESNVQGNGWEEIFVAQNTNALTFTPSNTSRFTIDNVILKKVTAGNNTVVGEVRTPLVAPMVSDAGTLGSTTKQWSDLFLADGAVINFNNGNYTLTHSAGLLTTSGDFLSNGRVRQQGTFAEIYVADGSSSQSIASGAGYTKLTAFTTNGSSANCTADQANDKITITKAGKYLVNCTVSGHDGVSGAVFKMALFYDGTEQNNIHATNKFNAGSEIDAITMSGILNASANKDIDVRLSHDAGGSVDFTTNYANLSITYIGE